jgi:hypothetical protein
MGMDVIVVVVVVVVVVVDMSMGVLVRIGADRLVHGVVLKSACCQVNTL